MPLFCETLAIFPSLCYHDYSRIYKERGIIMIRDFKDKVAFITGSASGIGSGIAHACAKHGMKVCIVDKREDALQEAMKWYEERG